MSASKNQYLIDCKFYPDGCRNQIWGRLDQDGQLICKQCRKTADDQSASRTADGGHYVQCKECLKLFATWRKLCTHWMDMHTRGNKLVCPICKMTFFKSKRGFNLFFRHVKKTRFQPHESGFEILDALDSIGEE